MFDAFPEVHPWESHGGGLGRSKFGALAAESYAVHMLPSVQPRKNTLCFLQGDAGKRGWACNELLCSAISLATPPCDHNVYIVQCTVADWQKNTGG